MQIPKKTALRIDEKLIPGNLPIVTYGRIRDKMFHDSSPGKM